jgi:hyperosmotically inducible protein
MKQKLKIIVGAAAVSVLALTVLAQPAPPSSKSERAEYQRQPLTQPRADRLNGAAKASDLIGSTVKNYQDEKIGKVEDLGVDVESGRIIQVILSTGGFIGLGETLTAVPPAALHHDVAQKVLHLDTTQDKFKAAPRFNNAEWNEGPQSDRLTEVYAYYGEVPDFASTTAESELTSQELKHVLSLPRHMDGTINTAGASTVESMRNAALAGKLVDHYNMRSTRNPDGTWEREYYPSGSETNAAATRLGEVQKASKVMGMTVQNRQEAKLGDVDNILVDLAAGRIVAVIISSGGFFGMRDELSAIPPTALRFTPDRDTLQLDASKETLSQAPHFKANQWPDFHQPGYIGGVYRAYQVEPYFTSDTTPDADNTRLNVRARDDRSSRMTQPDNTARNVRNRSDRSLTPLAQGTSRADMDTTAEIRKEIRAGKNMSGNARNVKIITRDGQITLRGPVNDAEEKRRIGEIAERSANARGVDNQLEVKFSTVNSD